MRLPEDVILRQNKITFTRGLSAKCKFIFMSHATNTIAVISRLIYTDVWDTQLQNSVSFLERNPSSALGCSVCLLSYAGDSREP